MVWLTNWKTIKIGLISLLFSVVYHLIFQDATVGLEKRMTNISRILLEKKELAKRDAELSERKYPVQLHTWVYPTCPQKLCWAFLYCENKMSIQQ